MHFTVYNLVYLIVCIVEGLIACQYFESIHTYEGSRKIQVGAFLLCYGILYFSIFFSENMWIGIIVSFVLNFFLAYFLYDIQALHALVQVAIMTAFLIVAQWLMHGIMESISVMAGGNQNTLGYVILTTVFSRLVYLIFMEIVIWIRNRDWVGSENGQISGIIALCISAAATCWGVSAMVYVELKQLMPEKLEWLSISGALAMLLANIIIYLNAGQSRRRYKAYMDAKLYQEKEKANVTYYRMLAEHSEEQKILIHDIRKHVDTLKGLMYMEDYGKAAEYLNELSENSALQPAVRVCDNQMASLILTQYKERCSSCNVRFYPDVRSKALDFLSMEEVTSLLANLMDNALEAAMGVEDAFIELRIGRRTRTQVVITMVNSCIRSPRRSRMGDFITHKQDAEKHGFGMKSIEKVLKKYDGKMETRYDENTKTFHILIIMLAE